MGLAARIGRVLVASVVVSPLVWTGADIVAAPDRIDSGGSTPECQAERSRFAYPVDDELYFIGQRIKFRLPTDLATRDRAEIETTARPVDGFALDLPLTDEEVDAFILSNVHQDLLNPLRDYFATIPDAVGAVAFNGSVLDPLFRIETTASVSAAQLGEIQRLTPSGVPTIRVPVEWSRAELSDLIGDIGAGIRGEPTPLGAYERIVDLGLVPHGGGSGAQQSISVFVDETSLGCDAQLNVLVADALDDLDVPPIVIEQSGRAEDD